MFATVQGCRHRSSSSPASSSSASAASPTSGPRRARTRCRRSAPPRMSSSATTTRASSWTAAIPQGRGDHEPARNDWGYTVNSGDLNPNDPVVNTASEYMYQMATIAYHTLNGTQTVVLTEPVDYNGKTYRRRHLRRPGHRPLLEPVRPPRSARRQGPRAGLDRHRPRPDRRARRRQRDRLRPADGPRHRRPRGCPRRHAPDRRLRGHLGRTAGHRDRDGQGPDAGTGPA